MDTCPNEHDDIVDTPNLISGIANHEAKSLLIARMAVSNKEVFRAGDLRDELVEAQGDTPSWTPAKNVPLSYAEFSLLPIGAVLKERTKNEFGLLANEYSLNKYGKTHGLAMAGLALKWSIDTPDLSVQQLFSVTHTPTKDGIRPPEYRLAILNTLLNNASKGLSYDEIEKLNPTMPNIRVVLEAIRISSASNLIEVTSNMYNYDPLLNIGDPTYTGRKPLEELKPERQAIYSTLRKLRIDRNIGSITLNGLIAAIAEDNPDIQLKPLRKILNQGIGEHRAGLKPLSVAKDGRGELGKDESTYVSLKSDYHEPISEIMDMINTLDSPVKQEKYRGYATEIASNISESKALMGKAYMYSPNARPTRENNDVAPNLMKILAGNRPLTVEEVTVQYNQGRKVEVSSGRIRQILNRLYRDEVIGKQFEAETTHGRTQNQNRYFIK